MGFKFAYLCDLLSSLEENRILKATTQARSRNPDVRAVTQWFAQHDRHLRNPDTDQLAFVSCMFPQKRTDRVYWLQDTSLARVIGRCLLLGSSRREELERWRTSGGGDLGQCVENVMRQAENHIFSGQEVTVEEIDVALNQIASRCRFSGPNLRRQRSAVDVEETLSPLYRRLTSRDAKWLTRMILKTHFSQLVPEKLALRSFHFLLPHLLLFQDSFGAALSLLSSPPISHFPPRPEPGLAKDLGLIALHHLMPQVGIKIGRPEYYKARSIKHCCKMIGQRRMSVERKYDGEYCQIHINLSETTKPIQIFSKSGKDSTIDRAGVHQAIKDALKIGKEGCNFSRHCILEGELVVWSDKHRSIMPFHKLRNHISRSGIFIGTEKDSRPQPYEHLMVVFFDVLLLDHDICLRKPHRERRLLLKDTVQAIPGFSDIAEQRVIDFSRPDGQSRLESFFSMGIAQRWEGCVLKGCEDPYFPILVDPGDICGRWIKLKKDYIPGLGDTVDLTLIGATYISRDASTLGLINSGSWTHFFIGCLENKDAVVQHNAKASFRIIDVIDHHSMSVQNMEILNNFGKYGAHDPGSGHYGLQYGTSNMPQMDVLFKTPFIVEILGSGFEKPSGARYYSLRFPRILKIHSDRSLEDAATFQQLQLLAENAVAVPSEDIAEEEAEWMKRVKSSTSMAGYIPDQSEDSSTASSPSPTRTARSRNAEAEEPYITSSHAEPLFKSSGIDQLSLPHPQHKPSDGPCTFPIYSDCSTASGALARQLEVQNHVLAEKGNLPSQGNAQKRKASSSGSELYSTCVAGKRVQVMDGRDHRPPQTTSAASPLGTGDGVISISPPTNVENVQADIRKNTLDHIRSPLSTAPLYFTAAAAAKSQQNIARLPNLAHTLTSFLRMLKYTHQAGSPNHVVHATRQKPTIGIFFADHFELGHMLLVLTKALSENLQAFPGEYLPTGRILLLHAGFPKTYAKFKSKKFCLRTTWEKISHGFFYACIFWEQNSRLSQRNGDPVDEIPGTPMDDRAQGVEVCSNTRTTIVRSMKKITKLRVSFDRKELFCLGEYSSLDPLSLVEDSTCG
ncbi:hypothetical protein BJX61DRAFT_502482 [Aspergillus egyptiacus]|nr:hypothetical protein BJX61DRAFT_502482 [Aspergillus egyptiacus]